MNEETTVRRRLASYRGMLEALEGAGPASPDEADRAGFEEVRAVLLCRIRALRTALPQGGAA